MKFKLNAIKRVEGGKTINSITNDLLIGHGLIQSWVKKIKKYWCQ